MKTKIKLLVALLVIVGVAYWAFDSVRSRSYSGAGISFNVGSGSAVVTNLGSEAIPVEMRSEGRSATFRVASTDLGLQESAKRQGSGANTYYAVEFELPAGQARIDVTRGSGVQFVSTSNGRIQAVVTPMGADSARMTLGFAGLVVLVALYYISRLFEHRWIRALRNRLFSRGVDTKQATT